MQLDLSLRDGRSNISDIFRILYRRRTRMMHELEQGYGRTLKEASVVRIGDD
jgi:phosphoenolpyruvate carboxylase